MTLSWKFSVDGGTSFCEAGQSVNPVYITLNNPITLNFYHSVVHFACANPGAIDSDSAVAHTWAFFPGPGNVTTWDGKVLYYYKPGFGWSHPAIDTPNLLISANSGQAWAGHGQCGAFASLFRDAVGANGVISYMEEVTAKNKDNFIAKDWAFGPPTYASAPPYIYKLTLVSEPPFNDGMFPAPAGGVYGDLTKLSSKPGQNTAPPTESCFGSHYVVQYNGLYYDPSYGVTYTGPDDFEDKAVDGYVTPTPFSLRLWIMA